MVICGLAFWLTELLSITIAQITKPLKPKRTPKRNPRHYFLIRKALRQVKTPKKREHHFNRDDKPKTEDESRRRWAPNYPFKWHFRSRKQKPTTTQWKSRDTRWTPKPPWGRTSTSLDLLLRNRDPLAQFHLTQRLFDSNLIRSRQELATSDSLRFNIAEGLCATPEPPTGRIYISQLRNEPPIVIDSGASFSVTPNLNDFIGPIKPCQVTDLRGLNNSITVQGEGTVEWEICDYHGLIRKVRTRALYVQGASVRLFSPQVYFQDLKSGTLSMSKDGVKLTLPDGTTLCFPYAGHNNLPLMLTSKHLGKAAHTVGVSFADVVTMQRHSVSTSAYLSQVLEDSNINLSAAQRELLLWHQKMGHMELQTIQQLLAQPQGEDRRQVIKPKEQRASSCPRPLCSACNMAKAKRQGTNAVHHIPNPEVQDGIRNNDLEPGDGVSMDQYISTTHGRLLHTRGREDKSKKHTGGTLFADHASLLIFCHHQVSLRTGETLKGKNTFEQFAAEYGRKIKRYHADNAPFRSREFLADCVNKDQQIDFSGVGAHHQNGVAERAIQTVTGLARAMMLHAIMHWPEAMKLDLWPMALDQATYIWNNTPRRDTRLSPMEVFTGARDTNHFNLRRLHVFGSPTFVLDPALQDGKSLPKWKPRARLGLYLGISPQHSTNVSRILNLQTGSISEQFHCVHDDLFTTVTSNTNALDKFDASTWTRLVESGYERSVDPEMDDQGNLIPLPILDDEWLSARERDLRRHLLRERAERRRTRLAIDTPVIEPEWVSDRTTELTPMTPMRRPNLIPDDSDTDESVGSVDLREPEPEGAPQIQQPEGAVQEDAPQRSGRTIRRPQRLIEEIHHLRTQGFPGENMCLLTVGRNPKQRIRVGIRNEAYLNSLDWSRITNAGRSGTLGKMWAQLEMHTDQQHNTVEWMNPGLWTVKVNDEDNPNWNQAMSGENKEGYWQAARKEIATLEEMNVWIEVDREGHMNIIPSTWAFRCKRYPDGRVRKLKARFCARGDQQIEGVDFFETYAPVINWQTVRVMVILSAALQLSTVQVDYTAAFVHADIDKDPNWESLTEEQKQQSGVYIEMPRGFGKPGKVLKLQKSLYGLKQSPRNFFLHLKSKLEAIGFVQQVDADPCLFISDKVICLVYVDDTLFFAKNPADIEEVIRRLRDEQQMKLEVEEDVAGFLGVHIDRKIDGQIEMTQKGLTDRIIKALNIGDKPAKQTPAEVGCLGRDLDGEAAQGTYNYASVIGMMQYLQGHTRPDITFAVSQCARYTHAPKRSHELALERIGLYLKATKDKGILFQPDHGLGSFKIDCYVDADFAGMWGYEDSQDPACVKSRTGYVIFIQNCPVVWNSKLQSDIALSTMEAEYNALSMSMRDVLPLQTILRAIMKGIGVTELGTTTFRGTKKEEDGTEDKIKTVVHEDNNGALKLAKLEPGRMTPRSKHYGTKYHWFRSKLKENEVEIERVDTTKQRADFLTKSLRVRIFEFIRKFTCGW